MEDKAEDTFDKLKAGAKAVAKKVSDPDKDLGTQYEKEIGKERNTDVADSDVHGSKEPMNPEEIGKHEPTAVKRDRNQPSTGEPV